MSSITISPCPVEDLDQLRPLLAAAKQKPYRFLARDLGGDLDEFWMQELAAGGGELLVARQGRQVAGMATLASLPWETKILGLPMGTLRHLAVAPGVGGGYEYTASFAIVDQLLKAATQRAAGQGFHSLLCKTYTDDMPAIHALEENGFLLVDTLLDFIYDYRKAGGARSASDGPARSASDGPASSAREAGDGVQVRLATVEDEAELLDLARISFANHFGRFHSDPRISRQDATTIYVEWIRSCLAGYADWIPVVEIDGKLAGYSAWKKPSAAENGLRVRVGHYSIAAIHPNYSGRGLFSILTQYGMQLLTGMAEVIEGPTHINNYPVQRGYANLRWRIGDARHSFHKWLI